MSKEHFQVSLTEDFIHIFRYPSLGISNQAELFDTTKGNDLVYSMKSIGNSDRVDFTSTTESNVDCISIAFSQSIIHQLITPDHSYWYSLNQL